MKTMKRTFTMHDKTGLRYDITAEIEDGKFSITGAHSNGGGQCQDSIQPANEYQKQLLEIWDKWHLNDMHAGCEHQEKTDTNYNELLSEYCKFADENKKSKRKAILLKLLTCSECGCIWGHNWIKKELPADFKATLEALINNIEAEEREKTTQPPTLEALMEEAGVDNEEAAKAYLEATGAEDLMDFNESYQGEFGSDEEFAQQTAEELGLIDSKAQWPNNCIDWEQAARELMYDCSNSNGYYFKNL